MVWIVNATLTGKFGILDKGMEFEDGVTLAEVKAAFGRHYHLSSVQLGGVSDHQQVELESEAAWQRFSNQAERTEPRLLRVTLSGQAEKLVDADPCTAILEREGKHITRGDLVALWNAYSDDNKGMTVEKAEQFLVELAAVMKLQFTPEDARRMLRDCSCVFSDLLESSKLLRQCRMELSESLMGAQLMPFPHAMIPELQSGERLYTVKLLNGMTVPVALYPSDSIATLKEKVARVLQYRGMSTDMLRLVWAGKELEDGRTISDYNCNPQTPFHCILRLRAA